MSVGLQTTIFLFNLGAGVMWLMSAISAFRYAQFSGATNNMPGNPTLAPLFLKSQLKWNALAAAFSVGAAWAQVYALPAFHYPN